MMRNDYATVGACASIGAPGNAEMIRKMQSLNNQSLAQDVYSKPAEPAPPLLFEALGRLQRVRDGLMDANGRLSGATTRILGPEPGNVCASSGATAGGPPCAADELLDLIRSIAIQVERLHEAASRVERIG